MGTLKITKKHLKHLNNPFPSSPRYLPFIQGRLFFDSHTVPSHQVFPVGKDFQLLLSSKNGGYLSISHQSQPTRALWSTIAGQAFVSAAMAETEVEESRGSFACELIERCTETIGRPPELPKWIISGAVVGMQGGTEAVHRVWDELRMYKVPISAFWLQVIHLPIIKYHRSEELLMRWMELNAFTTVFRTHEGNKPSCNSQFYSNHRTLSHFARCAKLYKAWYFYRIQLVKEATQKGLPICRHLFLHYPDDRHVHSLTYQQFLVGTEILVVPVLDKGKKNVKAFFPEGEAHSWKHVWSGKLFTEKGSEAWVDAPIGYPAIFIKDGSTVGETFMENLRIFGIL